MKKIIFRATVDSTAQGTSCDFLALRTGLSKGKVKEGMKLKAVSLQFRCPFQGRDMEFRIPET
jgi:hypothetical protein